MRHDPSLQDCNTTADRTRDFSAASDTCNSDTVLPSWVSLVVGLVKFPPDAAQGAKHRRDGPSQLLVLPAVARGCIPDCKQGIDREAWSEMSAWRGAQVKWPEL